MNTRIREKIAQAARNEITEYQIYRNVAARAKNPRNREILERIALQEKRHHAYWTQLLGEKVEPSHAKVWFYSLLGAIFGLSFTLRLMEKGEALAQDFYREIITADPQAAAIIEDEQRHESELLGLIDEKRLQYVSSFVLGLNDALVELTGVLAGLTLALGDTDTIAVVGLITGIAAALSMAAAEYLSTCEEAGKNPLHAGIMTGISYLVTVVLLITPYFVMDNALTALLATLVVAVLIVFLFTFYTSVAKGTPFKRRFLEMAVISLGVAMLNFGIGFIVKQTFGIGEV
ncbi:VIT1/CCC1 transporter family protein [Candidatus Peregrinibacteria bacterium]|nr:VIT1/CCC1 transporter family protein [Candidatus Peregrinibacteria bacterium]